MKKIIVTFIAIVSLSIAVFSQDVITKKTGDDVQVKIIEVNQNELKYKQFDNADGPTFTIAKSDILMVRYENGTSDVFNQSDSQLDVSDLRMKGKRDAKMNYKGKKTGQAGLLQLQLFLLRWWVQFRLLPVLRPNLPIVI
jgi:hypothetical protein